MFGYKHYVPVLKGKRAEFPAIGNLQSRDGVTPLFEPVPNLPIVTVPRRMSSAWEANRPYFIDLLYWDDEETPEEDARTHPLRACFAEVSEKGQHAIPVTSTVRSPAYQTALREIVRNQGRGFAIRLAPDDFEDEDSLPEAIDALVSLAKVPKREIDILVDVGSVSHLPSAGAVARTHRSLLEALPSLNEWRTLTVIAGSFPLGLAPLARGAWNPIPRYDWRGWALLQRRPPPRRPAFGDYTIANPDLPPTGRATILAQLRYSTPDVFSIYKGENVFTHARGYDQFLDICADLIEREEFCGRGFSHADDVIHERATTGGSPGNAETWRTLGVNHHIEMVKDQIANLS